MEANLYPYKLFVKEEFLYDSVGMSDINYKLIPCILLTVRAVPGQVPLFQVLLENGVVRDKLPSYALLTEPFRPDKEYSFHELSLWNSFSRNIFVFNINYLSNARVKVLMKDKSIAEGNYQFTIQWGTDNQNHDITLAEDMSEHKSHHVIFLDNGQIAIQPNNRILWFEPSFVTKHYKGEKYQINTNNWDAEQFTKWVTEDSNNYIYNINDENK